jgi:hypothetical protein
LPGCALTLQPAPVTRLAPVMGGKDLVMTDSELRGLLLDRYYQRRKERLIGLAPSDFDGKLNEQDILTMAGQLADHGLIHWRPNRGHGGIGGGMGTITAAGVAVVESKAGAPLDILLPHDQSLHGPAAPAVMPAGETRHSVGAAIERLARAIDESEASAAQKRAATVLLRAFQEHPLVCSMVQGAVGPSKDQLPKADSGTVNETVDESH